MSSFGSQAQADYATKLATRAGFASLEDATSHYSGRPIVRFDVTPYSKDQASAIITSLERKLGIHKGNGTDEKSAPVAANDGKPRAKFLTARHLRLIATHQEATPDEPDDDARWVLARLHRLDAIEAFVRRGQPDQKLAVNGTNPIAVEQVIQYFGTEESVADAFGVSVKTIRDWGQHLPATHAFKAEVLTHGYVQAPRA